MSVFFTCPHCGQRTTSQRDDLEAVDLGNGCPVSYFPPLAPGEERHVDQRECCEKCYGEHAGIRPAEARAANPDDPPHPFGTRYHREVRLSNPVGRK